MWFMIHVILSYIDENTTLSLEACEALEAVLVKKSPCKWNWD